MIQRHAATRCVSYCAIVLSLLCARADFVVGAEPSQLVLQGGAAFDAVAGRFQSDQTIVIEGDQIRSVSGQNVELPPGARTVDCRGKFIIPGLIDVHVHLVHLADKSHVSGDQFLPMFLANGVTSVRDAGDAIVAQSIIARTAELRPDICPRVFLTSPLIDTDPPLHRDVGYALTDPAKVGPFANDMAKWNVSTLKIYVGTQRAIGCEVIKEGHKAGMKVMAHLGAYSAQDAVFDGVDSLEHIWSVFNYIIPDDVAGQPDHRANLDLHNAKAKDLIANLARRRVYVDPTLVVFRNMIYLNDLDEIHNHPDLARVPRRMLDYWDSYRRSSGLVEATRESRRKEVGKYLELVGVLHQAGVPLLVGTDTPEPFVPPGYSLHQELELLVASGLSPAEALAAATIENARALNQEDRLGTIAPGKLADLVILDADPTLDIRHTRQIHGVVRGGMFCDPATVLKSVPIE
jgi:hypothetical protein